MDNAFFEKLNKYTISWDASANVPVGLKNKGCVV
jgi:hypothetical protein